MKTIALVLLSIATLAAQDAAKAEPPSKWRGLVKDTSVTHLPAPGEKAFPSGTLVFGAFRDAAAWKTFAKESGTKLPEEPKIDWSKRAILFVVLRQHTNSLDITEWKAEGRTGRLEFAWSLIEPHYGNRYPAIFHTIDVMDVPGVETVSKEAKEAFEKKVMELTRTFDAGTADERAKAAGQLKKLVHAEPACAVAVLTPWIARTEIVETRSQLQSALDSLKLRVEFVLNKQSSTDKPATIGEVDLAGK